MNHDQENQRPTADPDSQEVTTPRDPAQAVRDAKSRGTSVAFAKEEVEKEAPDRLIADALEKTPWPQSLEESEFADGFRSGWVAANKFTGTLAVDLADRFATEADMFHRFLEELSEAGYALHRIVGAVSSGSYKCHLGGQVVTQPVHVSAHELKIIEDALSRWLEVKRKHVEAGG